MHTANMHQLSCQPKLMSQTCLQTVQAKETIANKYVLVI